MVWVLRFSRTSGRAGLSLNRLNGRSFGSHEPSDELRRLAISLIWLFRTVRLVVGELRS